MCLFPIDSAARDLSIYTRMLLEVVRADARVSAAEKVWLETVLPGNALSLLEDPPAPLTDAELAALSPDLRRRALERARSGALVDAVLAPEEEALLARFARVLA